MRRNLFLFCAILASTLTHGLMANALASVPSCAQYFRFIPDKDSCSEIARRRALAPALVQACSSFSSRSERFQCLEAIRPQADLTGFWACAASFDDSVEDTLSCSEISSQRQLHTQEIIACRNAFKVSVHGLSCLAKIKSAAQLDVCVPNDLTFSESLNWPTEKNLQDTLYCLEHTAG